MSGDKMNLKLREIKAMNALLMSVEDEHGEKKIMIRMWDCQDERNGVWIIGNMTGPHMLKVADEDIPAYEDCMMPQVEERANQLEAAAGFQGQDEFIRALEELGKELGLNIEKIDIVKV